jgi:hypothetical protein
VQWLAAFEDDEDERHVGWILFVLLPPPLAIQWLHINDEQETASQKIKQLDGWRTHVVLGGLSATSKHLGGRFLQCRLERSQPNPQMRDLPHKARMVLHDLQEVREVKEHGSM